jgi:hypothetical protein
MLIRRHIKYSLFLSDFNETWIFSADFREILKYQISRKFVQWEPSCSVQTDKHDGANSRFSQFSNEPKNNVAGNSILFQRFLNPCPRTEVLKSSFRLPRQPETSRRAFGHIDHFPTLDQIESLGETKTPNKKKWSTRPLKYNPIWNVIDISGLRKAHSFAVIRWFPPQIK